MENIVETLEGLWEAAHAQHDGGPTGIDEEQDQLLAVMNLASELIARLQRLSDIRRCGARR